MKASRIPMSAWNLSADIAQVPTPRVIVTAVNTMAVPRSFSASKKEVASDLPSSRCTSIRS